MPLIAGALATSSAATALVPRICARPLLLAGGAASAEGLYWLSRVTEAARTRADYSARS